MAFAVMALRIWKTCCRKNRSCFMITANIYACIEMNFHELIKLINFFREKSMDEYFLPTLFGSQDCGEFFRHLRSLTTLCSTIVNFSMLDLLHRVHRVDFMNYAENILQCYGVNSKKSSKTCQTFQHQGLEEIEQTVLDAQVDAENEMLHLGLQAVHPISASISALFPEIRSEIPFETPITNEERNDDEVNTYADADVDLDDEHNYLDLDLDHLDITVASNGDSSMHAEMYVPLDVEDELRLMLGESANNIEIKHLIKENVSIKSSRLYFKMQNSDGKEVFVKKSTVVWLFNNVKDTVSSDRLYRFVRNNDRRVDPILAQSAGTHDEIHIGDRCEFKYRAHGRTRVVYGNVVGFEYINGRSKNYTLHCAPVKPPSGIVPRGIFVYANWFERCGNVANKIQLTNIVNDGRIDIDLYKTHIQSPTFINNVMTLA
ncbi:uncharacterized protein LOC129766873 [Toxorhynchites rutilus septentrionalis]|uniref:uncharacterized protein LOC129766873 n=1 Tax=Toxorhynchites rutilus septentrionalis TaxID=329112 RepID=UPI00247A18A8|nr:uncharacterized protein LOC129766873 [Toxorhynchites rutilus septentrionalis]